MGTHPIFESDFDCLTDMKKRPKDSVKSKSTRSGSKLRSGSKASGKISKKVPLNICEKSKRRKFMQLYSTTKKPLNERFTKIMKQRKKLEIAEEIEIQDLRNKYIHSKNKELCQSLEIDYLIRKEDSLLMKLNLQRAQNTSYDNDDRIDELNEDILDDELEEYFKQHPRKKNFVGACRIRARRFLWQLKMSL